MSEALLVASEHEIVLFVLVLDFFSSRSRFLFQVEYLFHHDYPSLFGCHNHDKTSSVLPVNPSTYQLFVKL